MAEHVRKWVESLTGEQVSFLRGLWLPGVLFDTEYEPGSEIVDYLCAQFAEREGRRETKLRMALVDRGEKRVRGMTDDEVGRLTCEIRGRLAEIE